jgi:hypothetical protein
VKNGISNLVISKRFEKMKNGILFGLYLFKIIGMTEFFTEYASWSRIEFEDLTEESMLSLSLRSNYNLA